MDLLCFDGQGKPNCIRMPKPDDGHQHVREDDMLKLVVPMVAARFQGAIIMPNLATPVTTAKMAIDYRANVLKAAGRSDFRPVMTLYLTDTLEPDEVRLSLQSLAAKAIKYYPPGLTTNSDKGVKDPTALWTKGTKPYECLRVLAEQDGVFLIHAADGVTRAAWHNGERRYSAGQELDPYDQEKHFLKLTLPYIIDAHPGLKISVEHMSTADGADEMRYWGKDRRGKLGCSLTAHHLLLDRRDVFRGGFNPYRSWMPVIQPLEHRQELRKFAAEGHSFVWLGSDSAPHPRSKKESFCCASGVLTAPSCIENYVEAFEDMNALDERFERFACHNWRNFFGFKSHERPTITLVREVWEMKPMFIGQYAPAGGYEEVVPFRLGEKIRWKLVESNTTPA